MRRAVSNARLAAAASMRRSGAWRPFMSMSARFLTKNMNANVRSIDAVLPSTSAMQKRFFADLPGYTTLSMPALSPTMESGGLESWEKQEGDALAPGDVMAHVTTDKATVDFECQDDGYLAKILVPAGTTDVPVGKPVAIVVENEEDVAAFKDVSIDELVSEDSSQAPAPTPEPAPAPAPSPSPSPAPTPSPAPAASSGDRVFASPYARKLARENNIDVAQLKGMGTGPHGRIVADDVEEFLSSGKAATAQPQATEAQPAATAGGAVQGVPGVGEYVDIPVSAMRRTIANRLTDSKRAVPHYYLTSDITIDSLLSLRKQLNAELPEDAKLSINDFLVKAAAQAMKAVPEVNSSWQTDFIRQYKNVDINVAVAVPDGLVTPVIRNVHSLGLSEISQSSKDLVSLARDRKLAPEDLATGTFTISNLGMFGIRQFAAIVNPPQSCILAVGAAQARVLPNTDAAEDESPYKRSTTMSVTLSCDHRTVDGAVGAQWLAAFKELLEKPTRMLLQTAYSYAEYIQ